MHCFARTRRITFVKRKVGKGRPFNFFLLFSSTLYFCNSLICLLFSDTNRLLKDFCLTQRRFICKLTTFLFILQRSIFPRCDFHGDCFTTEEGHQTTKRRESLRPKRENRQVWVSNSEKPLRVAETYFSVSKYRILKVNISLFYQ